jgi:hypothetical protein
MSANAAFPAFSCDWRVCPLLGPLHSPIRLTEMMNRRWFPTTTLSLGSLIGVNQWGLLRTADLLCVSLCL